MKHDGLNIDELIHYGTLDMIENFSPEIAVRVKEAIADAKIDANQELEDKIEHAEGIIEEIAGLVS